MIGYEIGLDTAKSSAPYDLKSAINFDRDVNSMDCKVSCKVDWEVDRMRLYLEFQTPQSTLKKKGI